MDFFPFAYYFKVTFMMVSTKILYLNYVSKKKKGRKGTWRHRILIRLEYGFISLKMISLTDLFKYTVKSLSLEV